MNRNHDFDFQGNMYKNKKGRLTKHGLSLGFVETKAYDIYRITLYQNGIKNHRVFVVAIYNKKTNKTITEEFKYLTNARKHFDHAEAWIVAKKEKIDV